MKNIPETEEFKKRFYKKLEQIRGGESVCWEWRWSRTSQGYGAVRTRLKNYTSHRVSFFFEGKEKLKPNMLIDHICSNRLCVNPNHLRQVTIAQNIALEFVRFPEKKNWKLLTNLSRGYCIRGHSIQTSEDLVTVGIKKRENKCKKCYRYNMQKRYKKNMVK